MSRYKIAQSVEKHLSDTLTPVSAFLRLRRFFPEPALLESSDYSAAQNSYSYICCDQLAEIKMCGNSIEELFPDGERRITEVSMLDAPQEKIVCTALSRFLAEFEQEGDGNGTPGLINGIFGYLAYGAVCGMEQIQFAGSELEEEKIPSFRYVLYRYVLAIDHFHNQLYIIENKVTPSKGAKSFNIRNLALKTDFQPETEEKSAPGFNFFS